MSLLFSLTIAIMRYRKTYQQQCALVFQNKCVAAIKCSELQILDSQVISYNFTRYKIPTSTLRLCIKYVVWGGDVTIGPPSATSTHTVVQPPNETSSASSSKLKISFTPKVLLLFGLLVIMGVANNVTGRWAQVKFGERYAFFGIEVSYFFYCFTTLELR